jgi:hypothetical protein
MSTVTQQPQGGQTWIAGAATLAVMAWSGMTVQAVSVQARLGAAADSLNEKKPRPNPICSVCRKPIPRRRMPPARLVSVHVECEKNEERRASRPKPEHPVEPSLRPLRTEAPAKGRRRIV